MPIWLAIILFLIYLILTILAGITLIAIAKNIAEEDIKKTNRKENT